jgi:hypothetical protein
MPVSVTFEMKLPQGAQIIRVAGIDGFLWLRTVVDVEAQLETHQSHAFKWMSLMTELTSAALRSTFRPI